MAAIVLADNLEVKCENNRGVEEDSKILILRYKSVAIPFTEM